MQGFYLWFTKRRCCPVSVQVTAKHHGLCLLYGSRMRALLAQISSYHKKK